MDENEQRIHEQHAQVEEKYLKLIELSADEKIICAIRKHPIGLLGIYFTGFIVTIAVVLATALAGEYLQQQSVETSVPASTILIVLGALLGIASLVLTYISGYIYQNNILILTSEKVAQIAYRNLIDRKVSQLSLGDLQDITVDQRGLFARVFQFGTLILETAGEQNNYNFTYTKHPQHCARELVQAHETSTKNYGN